MIIALIVGIIVAMVAGAIVIVASIRFAREEMPESQPDAEMWKKKIK